MRSRCRRPRPDPRGLRFVIVDDAAPTHRRRRCVVRRPARSSPRTSARRPGPVAEPPAGRAPSVSTSPGSTTTTTSGPTRLGRQGAVLEAEPSVAPGRGSWLDVVDEGGTPSRTASVDDRGLLRVPVPDADHAGPHQPPGGDVPTRVRPRARRLRRVHGAGRGQGPVATPRPRALGRARRARAARRLPRARRAQLSQFTRRTSAQMDGARQDRSSPRSAATRPRVCCDYCSPTTRILIESRRYEAAPRWTSWSSPRRRARRLRLDDDEADRSAGLGSARARAGRADGLARRYPRSGARARRSRRRTPVRPLLVCGSHGRACPPRWVDRLERRPPRLARGGAPPCSARPGQRSALARRLYSE